MGMTSAAEEKLDARIRPEITALRSRTSYPKRHRSFSVVRQRAEADQSRPDAGPANEAPGTSDADMVRRVMAEHDGGHIGSERTSAAAESAPSAPVQPAPVQPAPAPVQPAPAPVQPAPRRPSQDRAGTARRAVPEGPIRLTRRGRIVVGALVVIGVAAGAGLLWLLVAGQAHASSHVQAGQSGGHALARVVVRPGQTLWSIASTADPAADPRVIIEEIVEENSLAGTSIQPGQVLLVPRG